MIILKKIIELIFKVIIVSLLSLYTVWIFAGPIIELILSAFIIRTNKIIGVAMLIIFVCHSCSLFNMIEHYRNNVK